MHLPPGKHIYFLSDFHLGSPNAKASRDREKRIIALLDEIKDKAQVIFIVGDMFDFWYEYRTVVPKGYVRLLGKIAELTDSGISVQFFVGNHDMWMHRYFEQELNVPVYFEPQVFEWNGKKFLVGHGDGLGPGDYGYKFLKKIFRNPLCQWLFGILPPAIGVGLATYFSQMSRDADKSGPEYFHGAEKEWLVLYCKEVLEKQYYDYMIFGHRHLPIDHRFPDGSRYINLGEWINYDTYADFDGNDIILKSYSGHDAKIVKNW